MTFQSGAVYQTTSGLQIRYIGPFKTKVPGTKRTYRPTGRHIVYGIGSRSRYVVKEQELACLKPVEGV